MCYFMRRRQRRSRQSRSSAASAVYKRLAVMIDLCLGRGVSAIASYVAMTRMRKREDVLISREFAREIFAKGCLEGPTLLLKVLRGEHIDWKEIGKAHADEEMCRTLHASASQRTFFGNGVD